MATIGYLLSPFSWWNDAVINIPIAYLIATFLGLFAKHLFYVFLVAGYWFTNILGLVLMHKGAKNLLGNDQKTSFRSMVIKDLVLSVVYTFIMVLLIKFGFLRFPADYFK